MDGPTRLLLRAFDAAVAAAAPDAMIARCDVDLCPERTACLAVGKAAGGMARTAAARFGLTRGLIVLPHGQGDPTLPFPVIEAGHPLPDEGSLRAGAAALRLARGLGPDETLLVLVSGGASALLEAPPEGLTLTDLRAASEALLRSGLPITRMNAIRTRMSGLKGGGLAAATRARVVTLVLSDVPGDALHLVGSGPSVPPGPNEIEPDIVRALELPRVARTLALTPRTTLDLGSRVTSRLVGSPTLSLDAATEALRAGGVEVRRLGDALEGDAAALGRAHAAVLTQLPSGRPVALLSGGETTVRVTRRGGRGGRNKAYLAGVLAALGPRADAWGLAADTDGIDGTEDDAGAWFGPRTLAAATARGWAPDAALARYDTFGFFEAAGTLVRTGPTGTNVNDLRVLLRAC